MSHDHSHSHGTVHDHSHEMSLEEKLTTLLTHWVDHNNSHKDNFVSWAEKAREGGLEEIARLLDDAGTLSEKVSQSLEKARGALESS